MCLHLKIEYDRIGMYEFGLLTDNVEYHRGTEFLKADRLGSICMFTYTAFFISEKTSPIIFLEKSKKRIPLFVNVMID